MTRPLRARLRFTAALVHLAVVLALGLPAGASRAAAPVRVTSAPGSIALELAVPEPRLEPVGKEPGMVQLRLDGFDLDGAAGTPGLPVRVVLVAVPPTGDVRVEASGLEADVREGVLLAPVPAIVDGDVDRNPVFARADAAYAQRGETGLRARLLGVSWMRNQRVARVAILPAEYDAPARRLTLHRRVMVHLAVDAAPALDPAETRDSFEHAYREALVNYEQGRAWRRPSLRGAAGAASLTGLAGTIDTVRTTSIYAGRTWVKIAIERTGFYKIGFDQLRNLELFQHEAGGQDLTTRLDEVRLFTLPGAPVLPMDDYCDACDYREMSIAWSDDGDNLFNRNEDYFYFFALGPSDWASLYDPAKPETAFVNNPYETRTWVYLTRTTTPRPGIAGPAQVIPNVSGTLLGDESEIATFTSRLHVEQDNEYWPDASPLNDSRTRFLFWEKWFWRSRLQNEQFTFAVDVPGIDTTQAARVKIRTWGLSSNLSPPPGYIRSIPDHYLDVSFNDHTFRQRVFYDIQPQDYDTTFAGPTLRTTNQVLMSIPLKTDPTNPYRVDRMGFAWVEFYYQRRFEPVNGELAFDSPPGGGTFVYRVGPFTDPVAPEVFDVTDPLAPVRITFPGSQYEAVPGGFRLSFRASDPGLHRYRVVTAARIQKPPSANVLDAPATSLENLRATDQRADYIVVYYDGFLAAAQELETWRKDHLPLAGVPTGPYDVKIVPVSALYDQFSGGRTDPAAIRNFLRAAYYNWNRDGTLAQSHRPTFVTFLGDASYDFKNITGRAQAGQPGTLLPSFENGFDSQVRRQFATDDWILNVDNPVEIIPDFYHGRIPVGDPATALDVVRNKILLYEQNVPFGEYRNELMFIADDNEQGANPDPIGWEHVNQTTGIDQRFTPQHIDRKYVYLHTYPDGPGDTKPGAKTDIRNEINGGVAMFNYIGHGSPFKIADESVMLDTDVGTLVNAPRFPVFIAASCDVGKYNDPTVQSLGERLITRPGGGAIGVISATELAFSLQNTQLNETLYQGIFRRDSSGCQYHETLAEALLAAKLGSTNNQKYQLMGDAGARVNLPRLWTELTLEADTGGVVTEIKRGQTIRFRGRVVDCPGGTLVPMNGVASMLIEDSQPILTVPGCALPVSCITYAYKAGPMYRGDVGIANGTFEGRFVVPLEAREGPRGRVRAYVSGRAAGMTVDTDGVGSIASQVSTGAGVAGDNEGPRITLSFVGGSTSVRPDAELHVDLFDPSGILTTGHAPQNGIVVTIDGNTTSRADITSSFRYAAESYQSGTASYRLPGLSPGPHQIQVTAADNLASGLGAGAHRSVATLDFQVVEAPPLAVERAYLFPNPARSGGAASGGQFVVDAPGDSINVLLRVYTPSGRLIRTLKSLGGLGQVQLVWDGRDDEGATLANGIYFFTVHVNARESDGTSSARQRADARGRFVILNR